MLSAFLLAAAGQVTRLPPVRGENAYRAACHARACPLAPPERPAQHYLLRGRVSFPRPEGKPLEQEARVEVGGPARLRYEVRAGDRKRLYLLADRKHAWASSPDSAEFPAIPPDPFASQCWLRWSLLRWPWDFRAALETRPAAARRLRLSGPDGPLELSLDETGLPAHAFYAGIRLELADWRTGEDGRLQAHEWRWSQAGSPADEGESAQIERFAEIRSQVLILDLAFRPPGSTPPQASWILAERTEATDSSPSPTRITPATGSTGVVRLSARDFLEGPPDGSWQRELAAEGVVSTQLWRLWRGGRPTSSAALLLGKAPRTLPPGCHTLRLPAGLYLRWTTGTDLPTRVAVARLRAAARKAGRDSPQPVWVLAPGPDRRLTRRELRLWIDAGD